jgi:hypothetical protein
LIDEINERGESGVICMSDYAPIIKLLDQSDYSLLLYEGKVYYNSVFTGNVGADDVVEGVHMFPSYE